MSAGGGSNRGSVSGSALGSIMESAMAAGSMPGSALNKGSHAKTFMERKELGLNLMANPNISVSDLD